MRNPGPKELISDLPKAVQQKGGKAGAWAPTDCPSQKQSNWHEKEAVPASQKLSR